MNFALHVVVMLISTFLAFSTAQTWAIGSGEGEDTWSSETPASNSLKVLTFNICGLPYGFCHLKDERLPLICEELRKGLQKENWDVVLLQEAWMEEDRNFLAHYCGWPYSYDEDEGDYDSGLMILSRYPITGGDRLIYQSDGELSAPMKFMMEMFFGGHRKSALLAQIEHPRLGEIWAIDTHLDASEESHYRESQTYELVRWIKERRRQKGPVPFVLGGDFNYGPGTSKIPQTMKIAEKIFFRLGKLLDINAYESPVYQNTCLDDEWKIEGKKDHVWASSALEAIKGEVVFQRKINFAGEVTYLSDHFGYLAEFSWEK